MPDVVLVDDDGDYREVLSGDLVDRGFSVSCFADGPSFLDALSNGMEVKVALLDLALPEMTGFEMLDALRARGIGLPVVFLTGYSEVEREMQALDRGAVDFVDKARGVEVLAHRLRVILEGQRQVLSPAMERQIGLDRSGAAAMPEVQRHGELTLHPSTARALWRQRDVGLTFKEYKVLRRLVLQKGKSLTYRAIYDTVRPAGFVAGSGERGYYVNVRSIVKRIRKKFQSVDPSFSEIKNVPGVGYRWLNQ